MPPDGNNEDAPETIIPYNLHVSSRYLELTRKKLELTRLPHGPDIPDDPEWSHGTPKNVLEPNIDFWLEHYDWRSRESHFNERLPQYRTVISPSAPHPPLRLHFVHKRSSASNAIPLLYCHGWPGGILEVIKIVDELTSPSEEGKPVFHVIVPSIPGCGFSDASDVVTMGMKGVAEVFDSLMSRLGYRSYVAHGVDLGFDICRMLAIYHSSRCLAIHTTTPLPYLRPPSLTHRPWQYFKYLMARLVRSKAVATRLGYQPEDLNSLPQRRGRISVHTNSAGLGLKLGLHAKPHTLAYALCDSPVGLLAWTRESLHSRSSLVEAFNMEDAIDFTMMSWLPGPEIPLRYLAMTSTDPTEKRDVQERWTDTPLGISVFPYRRSPPASPPPPPPWAACVQPLAWVTRHHAVADVGWPVWERPREVADDMKIFFGEVVMKRDPRLRDAGGADLESVD
ncbi:MAG: hypothetical protein M1816_000317 [Peltula sp. TS41687]|nr:MAG: hypothetical protein M1816_000317 [Peltula sp. TS41687]